MAIQGIRQRFYRVRIGHRNRQVQIDLKWPEEKSQEDLSISKFAPPLPMITQSISLPKINHNRKVVITEIQPMKTVVTDNDFIAFGKYAYRRAERTHIFPNDEQSKQHILNGYNSTSGLYGQFYYENNEVPKGTGIIPENLEQKNPIIYKTFQTEKPILKYHSLKSQLFKYEKSIS